MVCTTVSRADTVPVNEAILLLLDTISLLLLATAPGAATLLTFVRGEIRLLILLFVRFAPAPRDAVLEADVKHLIQLSRRSVDVTKRERFFSCSIVPELELFFGQEG